MNPSLKLLAHNVDKPPKGSYWLSWQETREGWRCLSWPAGLQPQTIEAFTVDEWQAARRELGLDQPEVTEEEERMWAELDKKKASKYHKQVKGVQIDVYDVLKAFNVTNPADAHAIKKMLCPGQRGVKDAILDRREAIQSLERAIELESE